MEAITRGLSDGEVVFLEGEPSDFACIVDKGQIEVVRTNGADEVLVAVLGPGELLGEMGVIDGMPRSATARAKGETELREYEAQDFLDQISKDPQFAASIMGILVARLRHSTITQDTGAPRMPVPVSDPQQDALAEDDEEDAPEEIAEPTHPTKPADTNGPQRGASPQSTDAPTASQAHPITERPRILIAPLIDDPQGLYGEALDGWLGNAAGLEIISHNDQRLSDPNLQEADRMMLVRQALAESGASMALLGRIVAMPSGQFMAFSIVTPWPDEEARVSGFSVFDRFYIPVLAKAPGIQYLLGLLHAALPNRSRNLMEALEKTIPLDLARARADGLIHDEALSPEAAGRQLISLGNALARVGMLEDGVVGLVMAVEAYRAALDHLPEEDTLGRGLADLHLALVLNAQAERADSEATRHEARMSIAEAAARFDPVLHPYQYITAHARHGAILYRCAMTSRDLETCKQGVEAFNRALSVCDKTLMQDPWADTMNGLGQVLILLGRLARNTEFLVWASQVCRNAMEVRNQEHNPMGWARTQNNRATALFLLGRATGNPGNLLEAIEGFKAAESTFEQFQVNSLVETARRNRARAETALRRIDAGKGTPDDTWWDSR